MKSGIKFEYSIIHTKINRQNMKDRFQAIGNYQHRIKYGDYSIIVSRYNISEAAIIEGSPDRYFIAQLKKGENKNEILVDEGRRNKTFESAASDMYNELVAIQNKNILKGIDKIKGKNFKAINLLTGEEVEGRIISEVFDLANNRPSVSFIDNDGKVQIIEALKFIITIIPLIDVILDWIGRKFSKIFKNK